MNFKMQADSFAQLAKFIEKKAKGSELTFRSDNNEKMEISLTLADGDFATILFTKEGFPKITRARNLGDEL